MKLSDLIASEKITSTYRKTDRNPHMDGSDKMDNYRVTLRHGRSRMMFHFSKGFGHHGEPPTTAEVLRCLASDAAGLENSPEFGEWCSEYGYDADSRNAERVFSTTVNQKERLKNLLGKSLYNTLLWDTERE